MKKRGGKGMRKGERGVRVCGVERGRVSEATLANAVSRVAACGSLASGG